MDHNTETVLISGATGFIGSKLFDFLAAKGYRVRGLTRNRKTTNSNFYLWNPEEGFLDERALDNVSCIINLAGENIASQRWTKNYKEKIRLSRIASTKLLCKKALEHPNCHLKTFISASAVGIYGDTGNDTVTENSPTGRGFLSSVCKSWESALSLLDKGKIRVIRARIGMVLSPEGGALKKMLPLFKFGVGAVMGSGRQYVSWIDIRDLMRAFEFIIENDKLCGAVNLVSPFPVTNREFSKALAVALRRPLFLSMPKPAVSVLFGEMGRELLLYSIRAIPQALKEQGFVFEYPLISDSLNTLLIKSSS
ncbi:MAG: TIGR01777 family protein [Candidatus Dadabacteria bacterium]|nr:MAG: TIGR01777 family protein [Candidatus Dadabacteria bacterium]